ncbi:GAD-like domain-containing protein [Vibrio vulnificus]|uniref:GAD-like domain-containing protein n=1 Tax=Vibrio vulnificus TaxID=672 RepID=UPI003D9CAC40
MQAVWFSDRITQQSPTTLIPANPPDIEKYRGRLPDQLLEYWQLLGFSGFADGLFWLTNPAEYQDILDRLLEDTLFEQQDIYYVIARNAWGELQLFGEKNRTNALYFCSFKLDNH